MELEPAYVAAEPKGITASWVVQDCRDDLNDGSPLDRLRGAAALQLPSARGTL